MSPSGDYARFAIALILAIWVGLMLSVAIALSI